LDADVLVIEAGERAASAVNLSPSSQSSRNRGGRYSGQHQMVAPTKTPANESREMDVQAGAWSSKQEIR
jgi:hypothetical protein